MGIRKHNRPSLTPGDQYIPQTFTLTGAGALNATRVKQNGVTFVNSTGSGNHTLRLEQPKRAGIEKIIVCRLSSTADVRVQTHSTLTLIGGTTRNMITFTTGAADRSITLISKSTVAWGMVATTTGVTLSGSTLVV
jgi:hypothetical protein